MGYTHYWTHTRRFTNVQWAEVVADISAILCTAKDEGILIGDGMGEAELSPVESMLAEDGKDLMFNGLGGESCETFCLYQNRRPLDEWQKPSRRGGDFCKTRREPYDAAVMAVLCYLESVYEGQFSASSDGTLEEWQTGLDLARRALPTKVNMLQIPLLVRWEAQFDNTAPRFAVWAERYALLRSIKGEWMLFKAGNLSPLYHVPADRAEAFEARAAKICGKLQTSAYGTTDCTKMHRAHDRALRTLMEASEVHGDAFTGAPAGMLSE